MNTPNTTNASAAKTAQLYRMEPKGDIPLAGAGEVHTLKEWKRIYGYENGYMFAGKFIPVESDSPARPSFTPGPWSKLPIKGECQIEPGDYQAMLLVPELVEALRDLSEYVEQLRLSGHITPGGTPMPITQARAVLAKL